MARYDFSYKVRCAEQVARAVAKEIGTAARFRYEKRSSCFVPVTLSISEPTTKDEVVFRFEGGTVVRVFLFDMDTLTEYWRTPHLEDWVVYRVEVRYYELDPVSYRRVADQKVEQVWDAGFLSEVRDRFHFHTHLVPVDEITSNVGIFVDRVRGTGGVTPDYAHNQQVHARLADSVSYRVLVEGDRERAIEEAKKRLQEILDK